MHSTLSLVCSSPSETTRPLSCRAVTTNCFCCDPTLQKKQSLAIRTESDCTPSSLASMHCDSPLRQARTSHHRTKSLATRPLPDQHLLTVLCECSNLSSSAPEAHPVQDGSACIVHGAGELCRGLYRTLSAPRARLETPFSMTLSAKERLKYILGHRKAAA